MVCSVDQLFIQENGKVNFQIHGEIQARFLFLSICFYWDIRNSLILTVPRKCLLTDSCFHNTGVCGERKRVGSLLCSWLSWTSRGESRLGIVLIQKKNDKKLNTKLSINLPLNPNISILGDLDSITNISKDQGHFIFRASLIGKKLILQKVEVS